MKLEIIKVDDILQGWHDSGIHGLEPLYFKVLKKAKVKIKVRCETGQIGWMYPAAFSKAMKPDDVSFIVWKE